MMLRRFRVLPLAVLPLALLAVAWSGCAPSRSDLDAIRQEQEAIREDVEAIRALLEQAIGLRPPEPGAGGMAANPSAPALRLAGRPSKGSPDAAITLLEFSDYECAYCAQHATTVLPQIDRAYVQTGKIRYVFKHFPIEQAHPQAFQAHVAASCAGDEGKHWEMHGRLFANPAARGPADFVAHAAALGLPRDAFRACLESGRHDTLIREDIDEAVAGGVGGTPVFAFAVTEPGADVVRPVRVLMGVQPFEVFRNTIEEMLAALEATRPGGGNGEEVR